MEQFREKSSHDYFIDKTGNRVFKCYDYGFGFDDFMLWELYLEDWSHEDIFREVTKNIMQKGNNALKKQFFSYFPEAGSQYYEGLYRIKPMIQLS